MTEKETMRAVRKAEKQLGRGYIVLHGRHAKAIYSIGGKDLPNYIKVLEDHIRYKFNHDGTMETLD